MCPPRPLVFQRGRRRGGTILDPSTTTEAEHIGRLGVPKGFVLGHDDFERLGKVLLSERTKRGALVGP